ncbi:unnamed protein product [Rangifer tarandus platyrhynchus]|uniref:Uncharacterized protein n=1 Tax=Rangifer tarandus platyrhynchus TaxID=3082113 RepID=A0ABN8ZWB6_RANTA|nr:unnamed protein product [Rangifer tarandus platyrhynchus]
MAPAGQGRLFRQEAEVTVKHEAGAGARAHVLHSWAPFFLARPRCWPAGLRLHQEPRWTSVVLQDRQSRRPLCFFSWEGFRCGPPQKSSVDVPWECPRSSRVVLTSSHVPEFRKAFPQPPEHLGGEEPCPACSLPKGQDSQPRRSPSGAKRAALKNENVSVQRGTGLPMGTPSTNESPPPLPSRAGFSERIEGCEAGQGPFPLFCTCRGS